MRKGPFTPPLWPCGYGSQGYQTWYVTKEEQKHAEKRYKANGIHTRYWGDDLYVGDENMLIIVYKIEEEPEQLSFL